LGVSLSLLSRRVRAMTGEFDDEPGKEGVDAGNRSRAVAETGL
jgi:hypothetical protein